MSYYRIRISDNSQALVWNFHVNEEKCENPQHYDDYIRYSALRDLTDGLGVTYLYIDCNEETKEELIMGYISLRTSSLVKDMGEQKKFGYPALEISELAVDKRYNGQHIGTDMVLDAINIANELNEIASIKYLVLCADPQAKEFYEKIEFVKMHEILEEIPRERTNMNCIPMYIKLR